MNYDKPFRTFDDLVKCLENDHGLLISGGDEERQYISDVLHVIPYYDLVNGYKDVFMQEDRFSDWVRFSDLLLFYSFDHGLQNVLFPFSMVVEDYFKNILAHIMARDFGVAIEDYLDHRHYVSSVGKIQYGDVRENIRSVYEKKKRDEHHNIIHPVEYVRKEPLSIDEPTRHYVQHHNHVPPWILLKNVSFSNAINLLRLMKQDQKAEIAEMMINANIPVDQKIEILIYALTLIRKCRNSMAHNLKFISFDLEKYSHGVSRKALSSWIPRELSSKKAISRGSGVHDIYAYILFSMALIPDGLHKLLLLARVTAYLNYFSSTKIGNLWKHQYETYAHATGLPLDLYERLSSYQNSVGSHFSAQVVRAHL